MDLQRPKPPAYISHNPASLQLPSVPQTELSQLHVRAEITLPDLKTVLSPSFHTTSSLTLESQDPQPSHDPVAPVRRFPRIDSVQPYSNGVRTSMESAVVSPSDTGSVVSIEDRGLRSASVVSLDDPDVRIAAEALSGLGNPDFVRSSHTSSASHASSHASSHTSPSGSSLARASQQQEPEPLLELITRAHPWVGGTIHGSLNAYSTTKYYSPKLVRHGYDIIERNITNPMVNTVSSVGRMTGVESSIRRYYGGNVRAPSEVEHDEESSASKRRRLTDEEGDLESGTGAGRHDSLESRAESLPSYRPSKPPSYREEASPAPTDRQLQVERPANNRSLSSQVFVATSGLGVALSVTSRDSLRYCLGLLSRSAQHVTTVTDALKIVLEQYDQARDAWHENHAADEEKRAQRPSTPDHDEAARRLAGIIKRYSDDIWQTLQTVVSSVSNYAGGALPENARHFVRNQLMSLPQRWRFVSDNQTGGSETSRSAHRMIAFATEGLDMMSQVSQTMQLTLESAESWLERVGRRRAVEVRSRSGEKDQEMRDAHTPLPVDHMTEKQ